MVEYGGGISEGPGGQVGGGSNPFGQGGDPFGSLSQFANDAVSTVSSLSPVQLAVGIVIVFLALVILRRAF
ncbi:MAG TPA: hypothetical protein VEX41_02320 [Candidatus Eisenbacteria bacterium]|nr:hypothetical protein [Candidatus Eisenbacteria bacterium]